MSKEIVDLIAKAKEARLKAYAPYSKFLVGAAALMNDGSYVLGCNVENVSYGLSNCAERTCLFSMIAQGLSPKDVKMFCIIGSTNEPISPCGACRQVMDELLLPETPVILANLNGDYKTYLVKDLLPYQFKEIEHAE